MAGREALLRVRQEEARWRGQLLGGEGDRKDRDLQFCLTEGAASSDKSLSKGTWDTGWDTCTAFELLVLLVGSISSDGIEAVIGRLVLTLLVHVQHCKRSKMGLWFMVGGCHKPWICLTDRVMKSFKLLILVTLEWLNSSSPEWPKDRFELPRLFFRVWQQQQQIMLANAL